MVKDLLNILDEFQDKRILVIGDIMLDKFLWGTIERINPEQPASPLFNEKNHTYLLGGAANVANNVVSLGGKCDLWGSVGDDFFGKKISDICEKKGISLKNFYYKNSTIVKTRAIAHGQQVWRHDQGEHELKKIEKETERVLLDSLKENIDYYDFIVLSDYNKTIFTKGLAYSLIGASNQKNIGTLADVKPINSDLFKKCTIICPNKHEAEEITGIKYSNENGTLAKISECLLDKTKSKYAVITCSEEGAFLYGEEISKPELIPTRAKDVADVTGAGDTFAAALALGMSCEDKKIENIVELANYAAGVVVGKVGTATTTPEELKEYINKE